MMHKKDNDALHFRNNGGVGIAATGQTLLTCGRELTTDSLGDCTLLKANRGKGSTL